MVSRSTGRILIDMTGGHLFKKFDRSGQEFWKRFPDSPGRFFLLVIGLKKRFIDSYTLMIYERSRPRKKSSC